MDAFPKLIIFRLVNSNQDSVAHIVVERGDVLPAKNHFRINGVVGPGNEIGATKHGKVIQDTQGSVDSESVVGACGEICVRRSLLRIGGETGRDFLV